ncbi:hypothetical protein OG871_39840 (plasmid) [Kitasatospora sp. NBC_00374]|uniref:hypothetical protein n=1 Tax=Kitasatospora sp. NBC_00374 TaxID=2975964 RepID=UPI00324A8075
MTSVVTGIAVAAVVQEVLDDAACSLRISLERRSQRPVGAILRELAPEPELTPMQQVEIAASSAAAYEARWQSNSILGTNGPLRARSWTGAADGSATLDLPFGAVLHYRPTRLVEGIRTQAPWKEEYLLAAGGFEVVVRTGGDLLAYLQRLADGKSLIELAKLAAVRLRDADMSGCSPEPGSAMDAAPAVKAKPASRPSPGRPSPSGKPQQAAADE